MNEVMKIGEYQIRNLIESRTNFLYLDLRIHSQADHELLVGSIKVNPNDVLSTVRSQGVSAEGPIVLVCETGEASLGVARELSENGFINVFVLEGGVETLA